MERQQFEQWRHEMNKEMKIKWDNTYENAFFLYKQVKPRKQLYFDHRYWTKKDIITFFKDLQKYDQNTWQYHTNHLPRHKK